MTKYKIVCTLTLDKLEGLVNNLIEEGWYPIGGVSTINCGYCQAMILEK